MNPRECFLAAVRNQPTDRPALGSVTSVATTAAMAVCGAAFPDAHREPHAMASLAACASLDAGFDMLCPLFSVVHEAAALGAPVDWGDADRMPVITERPWRSADDIAIPVDFERRESLRVPLAALARLRAEYGREYALVGKVFGPWSLALHLFGVEPVLLLVLDDPAHLARILARLAEATLRSALAQVAAGADVLCLADHCSRDLCSPATYRDFVLPLHRQLVPRIPCPVALHTCGDTSDRIPAFATSGITCFHYDTRVPAATARALAGERLALMGGVSNVEALLPGDQEVIQAQVRAALSARTNIIGPECAVPLGAPLAGLRGIGRAAQARVCGMLGPEVSS
jgi:[methyl-Co(III) methanol-specific corrinoid protein]:coenzyme M methyltransferase